MRSEMEDAGRKGDWYIKNYPDFNPFSREEIYSYLGFLLAKGMKINPQINFWFFRTHYSTICGNNNASKLFPIGSYR